MEELPLNKEAKKDDRITRWIITTAWLLCVLTVLTIILTSVYLMTMHPEVPLPSTLKDWGGLAIGFIFGSMISIIKDYIINTYKQ